MKLRIAAAIGTILALGLLILAFASIAYADPSNGRSRSPAPPRPPGRIIWTSTVLTNTAFFPGGGPLAAGTTYTATASFTVTAAISTTRLTFQAVPTRLSRDGRLTVDATDLPAQLQPGQTYSVPVRLQTPSAPHRTRLNATVMVRQGHRLLARSLIVRVLVR